MTVVNEMPPEPEWDGSRHGSDLDSLMDWCLENGVVRFTYQEILDRERDA